MRPRVRNTLPYACDERKKGGDKNSPSSSEQSVELWELISNIVLRARDALTGPVNQQPSTAQHNYVHAIRHVTERGDRKTHVWCRVDKSQNPLISGILLGRPSPRFNSELGRKEEVGTVNDGFVHLMTSRSVVSKFDETRIPTP